MHAELKVEPDEIWINVMSGAGSQRQPKKINLTLIVSNPGNIDYHADHPNSGIFRFWVTQDGAEIWRSPDLNLPVVTPVDIPAGQSMEGRQVWEIADARKLSLGQCLAFGEFVPTALQAQGVIRVDEAH